MFEFDCLTDSYVYCSFKYLIFDSLFFPLRFQMVVCVHCKYSSMVHKHEKAKWTNESKKGSRSQQKNNIIFKFKLGFENVIQSKQLTELILSMFVGIAVKKNMKLVHICTLHTIYFSLSVGISASLICWCLAQSCAQTYTFEIGKNFIHLRF